MSMEDIAAKYGVTATRVQRWLADDRAPASLGRKPLELAAAHVTRYRARQASAVDIAADVGRRASTVRSALHRAGVPVRKRTPNTNIRLTADDQEWVRQYNPRLDLSDSSQRARLNTLIAAGSRHLYKDDPDDLRANVLAARAEFLTQLSISVKGAANAGRNLILPSNIVINSRLLAGHRINLRKLASDPKPLASRNDVVQAMLDHLASIGIDVKKACEGYTPILTMDPAECADRMAHMQALGISPIAVMTHAPQLVSYTKQAFTQRVEHLANAGVDVVAVANIQPRVLLRNPTIVTARLELLAALGLDPAQVVTANSSIFGFSTSTISSKVRLIRRLARKLGHSLLAEQCIHHTPVLQMSTARLGLLAHIWSTYTDPPDPSEEASPEIHVNLITNAVRISIARYIIAIGTDPSTRPTLRRLYQDAKNAGDRLAKADRNPMAYEIAASGRIGKLGTRYLRYIGRKANRASQLTAALVQLEGPDEAQPLRSRLGTGFWRA